MHTQKLLIALTTILLITVEVESIKNQIMSLCEDIQNKLNEYNAKIKELTSQMNELVILGQVDFKAAAKPKSQEVIELSGMIEETAKKIQKIYDNQDFIKFCVILHEEESYKELPA